MALTIEEHTSAVQVNSIASEVSSLLAVGHKSMTLLPSGVAMELFEEEVVLVLPAVALVFMTTPRIDVAREISSLSEVVIFRVAVAQDRTIHALRSAVEALFNEGLAITLRAVVHRLSILAHSCAVVELFNVKKDTYQTAVAPRVMTQALTSAVIGKLCKKSVTIHHVAARGVMTPAHISVAVEISYAEVGTVHGAVALGATTLAPISVAAAPLLGGVVIALAAAVREVTT